MQNQGVCIAPWWLTSVPPQPHLHSSLSSLRCRIVIRHKIGVPMINIISYKCLLFQYISELSWIEWRKLHFHEEQTKRGWLTQTCAENAARRAVDRGLCVAVWRGWISLHMLMAFTVTISYPPPKFSQPGLDYTLFNSQLCLCMRKN